MTTKREYAIKLGLASRSRGRMSREAHAAINAAIANGMVFDEPVVKTPTEKKPRKVSSPKPPRVEAPDKSTYSVKAVRAWAEQTGVMEKGRRGRIPADIVTAYLASHKPLSPAKKAVKVARTQQRSETVGWTIVRRPEGAPAYVSEPLVAVTSCGRCAHQVKMCACDGGPKAPKYLGGETLLLTKPTV